MARAWPSGKAGFWRIRSLEQAERPPEGLEREPEGLERRQFEAGRTRGRISGKHLAHLSHLALLARRFERSREKFWREFRERLRDGLAKALFGSFVRRPWHSQAGFGDWRAELEDFPPGWKGRGKFAALSPAPAPRRVMLGEAIFREVVFGKVVPCAVVFRAVVL